MSTHRITPDQVRRIEDALEERNHKPDRRQDEPAKPVDSEERRESRNDRRQSEQADS